MVWPAGSWPAHAVPRRAGGADCSAARGSVGGDGKRRDSLTLCICWPSAAAEPGTGTDDPFVLRILEFRAHVAASGAQLERGAGVCRENAESAAAAPGATHAVRSRRLDCGIRGVCIFQLPIPFCVPGVELA